MRRPAAGALLLPVALCLAAIPAAARAEEPPSIPPPPARQEPIGQINGTVFDGDRKGVVGLPITLVPQNGSTLHGTSTDNGGRYAFKGLETGTYSVVATLPAGGVLRKDGIRIRPLFRSIVDFTLATDTPQPSPPPVGAAAGGAPGDTEAPSGPALTALLAGVDRSPVPDALLTLTPVEGRGRFQRARSGADGACSVAELPPGTYRITVRAPGFLTWSLGPIALGGSGPLRLSLGLVAYPMGFPGTVEDLLIPAEPIPPSPAPRGN